jgi:hypothetical protein
MEDAARQHFPSRPGWPRRHGPHPGWPAVPAAGIFHVLGARSVAADGGVFRPMDLLSYAILLVGPLALIWRRRYPVSVTVVASAASIAFASFAQPRWMYAVAPAIALFSVARAGRRRDAILTAAGAYTAYILVTWVFAAHLGVPQGARADLRVALLLAAGWRWTSCWAVPPRSAPSTWPR